MNQIDLTNGNITFMSFISSQFATSFNLKSLSGEKSFVEKSFLRSIKYSLKELMCYMQSTVEYTVCVAYILV